MAAQVVGLNSTFNYQRQVVNELAVDVDVLKQSSLTTSITGIYTSSSVGIGTTNPIAKFTVEGDVRVSGTTTSFGGFVSGISTTAVKITVVGSQLLFTVPGVGVTSLTLF